MTVISKSLLAAVALLAAASLAAPVSAGGAPKTLGDYLKIAGETGAARLDCNMELDFTAMQALSKPFQRPDMDAAAADEIAGQLSQAMTEASARYQSDGEAFCQVLLDRYGPEGSIAPGLVSKRVD